MASRTQRIPSGSSNTSAGAAKRAANRLSRVSPSEFDRVLLSNETVVFSEGRNEDLLGRSTRGITESESYPDVSADEPTTPDPRSSLLSTSTSSSSDTRRRPVSRSSVTAVSPDRIDLNIKGRRSNSEDASGGGENDATSAGRRSREQGSETDRSEGSWTPEGKQVSSIREVDGETAPVGASSRTPNSSTLPSAPVALSIPADLLGPSEQVGASEPSFASVKSYVHVGIPSEEMAPSFATLPRRGSGASGKPGVMRLLDDSPTKRNRSASIRDDESTKSSRFSNTMRKTSRFFRKLGSSSKTSASSSTLSAPSTPTTGSFPYYNSGTALPVPSIPLAYAQVVPSKRVDSRAIVSPPPRKGSVDITISSPRRLSNLKEPLTYAESPSHTSLSTTASGHSRRRSVSLSSAAGPLFQRERRASVAKGAEEEDRLRGELQRWKQDIDGMLGSVGDGDGLLLSPNGGTSKVVAKKAAAEPPSPVVGLPKFTPLDLSFPGASPSASSEKVRPTWDTNWTNGSLQPCGTTDPPTFVPPRAASLPNPSLDSFPAASTSTSTLPHPLSASPISPPPAPLADEPMDPPRIRLVSPDPSFSDDPDDEFDSSPPSISQTTRDKRLSLIPGPASLATITESSHSRESSLTTPTKPSPVLATPEPSRAPPLVFTQSPSPGSTVHSSQPPSRKHVRQSVVAYPAGRAFSSTPGQSSSSSRTSLQSDGLERREEIRSAEEEGMPLEEKTQLLAQRCWDEDGSLVESRKLAEWLGSLDAIKAATLTAYIEMFDFAGLRLDLAFRRLCEKLYLKAESQQIDRILVEFSRWYWENNPTSLYRSADIVHAVSYSLLLLNTDLHVVDSTVRMSRRAFVANILHTINEQACPEILTSALLFGPNTTDEPESNNVFGGGEASASHRSVDRIRDGISHLSKRSGSVHSWKSGRDSAALSTFGTPSPTRSKASVVSPSGHDAVRSPSLATITAGRAADAEIEPMLKEMYNAIKAQPIYQRTSSTLSLSESRSSVSLAPGGSPYGTWSGGIHRSASRRSATPSTMSGSSGAFKRSSMRGFSFLGSSSADLARSGSPTPSSTTSLNDDNSSTAYGATSHHQIPTIGFANSLSHTIIREQQEDDNQSDSGVSVTDEELALLGAPWAKEGILWRKHFWESVGKRSKEKNWLQVFVVISQGEVRMFRFDGAGTTREGEGGAGLGGGDWASNAQRVGEISLTHALCASLPPPGYNRDRPHCFALTLPGGSSYFFQAGTQDLVQEWVQTCNYWSARLSKEPLSGGVSNMEYGWNRVVDADDEVEEMASIRSGKSGKSGRSVRSKASYGGSTTGGRNDRIVVHDWKPPSTPLGASTLSEEAQLESLKRHVKIIDAELEQHKVLRTPISRLFSPRSVNLAKANSNWERKLQHLSAENVKYGQYVESLSEAIRLRFDQRGERLKNEMLLVADHHPIHERSISPAPPASPTAEGFDEELVDDTPSVVESVDEFFDLPSPTSPTSEHAT